LKTIGVDLWGGQQRGDAQNRRTCVVMDAPRIPRDFKRLFKAAYPTFAEMCRGVEEPGIAVIGVDELTGRAVGMVRLLARVDRHVAAIVGRHGSCDLFLDGISALSLRHLAVIVDPVASWKRGDRPPTFRILDLRTQQGFDDESGRTLRGMRCEGPAMIRCGGYALFALPIGDPTDWPASADDAWQCLPERVYFDEVATPARGSSVELRIARPQFRHTAITRTNGPRDTGMRLVTYGELAGILELAGPHRHGAIQVGAEALRDGVLIGRYERCDNAQFVDDPSISRVHALLIQIDDTLLVIDTASRNGTRESGAEPARLIQLRGSTELALGWSTRARWRWLA
jgi:hypothetical protein